MLEYDHQVWNSSHDEKQTKNLSPALIKSLHKIIQSEGYQTHSIYKRNISTGGGNYLSILMEVDIKGKTVTNDKETHLFIKQCLPNEIEHIISPQEMLLREKIIYNELTEVLAELQSKFHVPETEKYNIIKCYSDESSDSLILENMARRGFKTYNRLDVMPLKALELTITQIAKFHALSMALERYEPDYFRNKIEGLKYPFSFNDNTTTFLTRLCKNVMEVLEDDSKIKLEQFVTELSNKYFGYLHKNKSKTKCLCHGDLRMNNILVKEIDGQATTVIPVDFQVIYHNSPAMDLIYLIFTSTNQEIRKNELDNLKKIYYESLKKFLKYFAIDVESAYPHDEFENDFKTQLDYGLIVSFIILPLILADEDDVPELNIEMKIKLHHNFKKRFQENVDDLIQWGYL